MIKWCTCYSLLSVIFFAPIIIHFYFQESEDTISFLKHSVSINFTQKEIEADSTLKDLFTHDELTKIISVNLSFFFS